MLEKGYSVNELGFWIERRMSVRASTKLARDAKSPQQDHEQG